MLVGDDIPILRNDNAGAFSCQGAGGITVRAGVVEEEALGADLVVLDAHHRGDHLLGCLLAGKLVAGDHAAGVLAGVGVFIQGKGCRFVGAGAFHVHHAGLDQRGKNAHRTEGHHRAAQHGRHRPQKVLLGLLAVPGLFGLGRLGRCVIGGGTVLLACPIPGVGVGSLGLAAVLPAGLGGVRVLSLIAVALSIARGGVGGLPLGLLFLLCILVQRFVGIAVAAVFVQIVVLIRIIHKPLLLS